MQPDPSRIEVVSVTDEDLPTVETPNTINISPISFNTDLQSEDNSPRPEDPQSQFAPSPAMPTIKVQPFIRGESWEHFVD